MKDWSELFKIHELWSNKNTIAFDMPVPVKTIYTNTKEKVTVVIFTDGSKTICRCAKGDVYNEYAGICICLAKKVFGKNYIEKISSKKIVRYNETTTKKEGVK